MVVRLAVWLSLMVIEAASVEALSAVPANKAFWVPLAAEGRDVVFGDGSVATTTLGCKLFVVVFLAIGLAITFVEATFPKLFAALGAEEVLRMPCLIQCCHTFI